MQKLNVGSNTTQITNYTVCIYCVKNGKIVLNDPLKNNNDMSTKNIVQALNDQLNREVSTFLRYMLQAASIKGAEFESVRNMYLEEVLDEVRHAQYLANQIEMLGSTPKLDPDLTRPPENVSEMLKNDAEEEKKDVKNYKRLAKLAEEEDLLSLKMNMEDQGAEEDEHGHEMRRLLG